MAKPWRTPDGKWEVEPLILDGKQRYKTMGPGMRGPEYLSLAELERLMGDAFAELTEAGEDA